MNDLLKVHDLNVRFASESGTVHAVNGVNFTLAPGETLTILGESGSGKSVAAQAIMGVVPSPPGHVSSGCIDFPQPTLHHWFSD